MKKNYYSVIGSLIGRTYISPQDIQKYETYKKGKEGERKFLEILNSIDQLEFIYDLQLQSTQNYQFDFIVITDKIIYQFEIKNYFGKYEFNNGNLICDNGFVIKYPLAQLDRNDYILNKVLDKLDIERTIKSYIIFINGNFSMKGKIDEETIILPNQLNKVRHLLNNNNSPNNSIIKTTLQNLHTPFEDDYHQYPNYEFNKLKPGIRCTQCNNIIDTPLKNKKKIITCTNCFNEIPRKELILNTLDELMYLKGAPFNMKEARKWCNGVHRNTLSYIMKGHFKMITQGNTKVYYK